MQFSTKKKKRAIINITSLVDVLFLLLIFFIVSSTFMEQPGMKLDLPESEEKNGVNLNEQEYIVYISREGDIFLNEEQVELENLGERLRQVVPQMKDRGLILKGDEKIEYGLAVRIMDIARQNGVEKLIIATQLKERPQE